jgi:uncharacterized protein YndB with AHSA1/START domain
MNNQTEHTIERTFNAPLAEVWNAITDKDAMKKWYFDLDDFKAEPGFKFSFPGGDENQYIHLCEVIEVIDEQKLSYSWRYEGLPGDTTVTFELFDDNGKTRLKLTHAGIETFKANGKDFAIESFTTGWTQILSTNLKDYLEKG